VHPADAAWFSPRPPYWEKVVLAAYLRALGGTQTAAGAAVGRSVRTIRVWESDAALWREATEEARQRWLGEVTALARRQLLTAMADADGDLALRLLERLDAELAPPAHRLKHEGAITLTQHPEWQALRTAILHALADLPEARLRLAAVLTGEPLTGDDHGHGATNGTRH
jgi:hypothetical protein